MLAMSRITIHHLDETLKASLRIRPARHGLSMEQEIRNILQTTLAVANPWLIK
jgi:plasmid stability protein